MRKNQPTVPQKGSAREKVDWKALDVVHPDAAGIDVGGSEHWVAVSPDRDPEPVRRFGCFTVDLREMAQWLIDKGVRSVAMQSTGVYWMPVLEVLEQNGLEVYLVNARHTKNLPGRKSDVQECQGLLKLHAFGLLNNSFQPTNEIRIARTLWRHRGNLVAEAGSAIQRMQKVLTEMNIQLANVLSDLSGVSGMKILGAILEGERDPWEWAALARPLRKHLESFGSTVDLREMAQWLIDKGVRSVAMQSTGVYWVPGVGSAGAERSGSISGECPAHQEPAGTQERCAGVSMAAEVARLWTAE